MQEISWRVGADGDLILGEDAGRMRFRHFPSGISLATSALRMEQDTLIRFGADPDDRQVSAQYFLTGEAEIRLGNGDQRRWIGNTAMLIRSDTPGFELRIARGQILRHVCICLHRESLQERIRSELPAELAQLIDDPGPVDIGVPLPGNDPMRHLANELYNATDHGLDPIRAETRAVLFLIEALEHYREISARPETPEETLLAGWRRDLLGQVKQAILGDPGISLEEAMKQSPRPISEAVLRQMFQSEFGVSLAAFQRQVRLDAARRMLEAQDRHVKEVAFDCGYSHLGNFTRAYRNHFGEAPSETRRRGQGG